ncbi:MAG: undecaprenyl-diphosphate phosphatase [Bacteroidetes bacterium]|nr:undecaprenyl-diphosphate phosphatase [Bacteroidota bacterium]MDA0860832.1 undecaprenyl-diphosphate phosphatase [Bacteroidota bacterium]MDA1318781.1 undecaprenyl-diphosphate phosphatase [Bacteroidota bacterium]
MDYLDSLILGIIQGLTEFLPVSSSGHLELGKSLLGDNSLPKESMIFTVVLHFATALSTIVVFRKDIFEIIKELLKFEWNSNTQFIFKIIISMLPAALIGVFFETELESLFSNNIVLVGAMLIITGLLLLLADRAQNTSKNVSFKNAFTVGVAQAVAILPGISRSGATISTAVLLGIDKTKAARFSFLMVIPLIFGKIFKDIFSGELSYENAQITSLGIGFITAFVSGLLACTWMIRLVKNSQLKYFTYYCAVVGIIAILSTYF